MSSPLSQALAHLATAPAHPRLSAWADELWADATARWPTIEVDAEAFARFLLPRLRDEAGPLDPSELEGESLFLAHACGQGSSVAIAELERSYARQLDAPAMRAGPARRQEFRQVLREKLFVAEAAKILDYAGRGSLSAWLRVTAKRTFLDLERGRGRRRDRPSNDGALVERAASGDPELAFLKNHYREQFREAFATAMTELDVRHRNVLRQHMVHGLSIDEIGALYEVHRATAARWISRAREAVLRGTRAKMREQLRVDEGELDSIMRLIESRLDVTVSRHLGE